MKITDPVTALTDYLLAGFTFYFGLVLARTMDKRNRVSAWLWSAAFVASMVGAIAGGTFHALSLQLDASTLRTLWNITVYSIGTSTGLMVGGVHAAYIRKEDGSLKWLLAGIAITLVGLAIQSTDFRHSENFNHNDLFHVVQIGAYYCFFRFARMLRDRPGFERH
jgi:hypothetical protein